MSLEIGYIGAGQDITRPSAYGLVHCTDWRGIAIACRLLLSEEARSWTIGISRRLREFGCSSATLCFRVLEGELKSRRERYYGL